MIQKILNLDRELFRLVNVNLSNGSLDQVAPFLRNSNFWVPLYLFLLVFALQNFRKNKWWWIVFAVLTAVLTDFVSSDIVKENIFRLRPCHVGELGGRFLVNYCPISSSFTSSHAANHFGMATFIFFTVRDYLPRLRYAFFAWAFVIIYAQVYVGVHYPADVAAGALLGFVFGYLSSRSFNRHYGLA